MTRPITKIEIERVAHALDVEDDEILVYEKIREVETAVGSPLISNTPALRLLLQEGYRSQAIELWRRVVAAWNLAVKSPPPRFKVELQFTSANRDFEGDLRPTDMHTQLTKFVQTQYTEVRDLHCTVELILPGRDRR